MSELSAGCCGVELPAREHIIRNIFFLLAVVNTGCDWLEGTNEARVFVEFSCQLMVLGSDD